MENIDKTAYHDFFYQIIKMIKEKVRFSFSRLCLIGCLLITVFCSYSCKSEEYLVYKDGNNIYHYTECLDQFAVKLNPSFVTEEMSKRLDSLGMEIFADGDFGGFVCRKLDGTNFTRDTCWQIASVRSMPEVLWCSAILEIRWYQIVNHLGDTLTSNADNVYYELPGRMEVRSLKNYGEDYEFIDSLIKAEGLTFFSEDPFYPACSIPLDKKFRCDLKMDTKTLYGGIELEKKINREHADRVRVQQILYRR